MVLNDNRARSASKIWIIVTLFDRQENLSPFLERICLQDYPHFELVIVDHGHTPALIDPFPFLKVIRSSPEKWWTGAINDGLRYVLGSAEKGPSDYIVLLNEDVEFEPSLLSSLVRSSDDLGGAAVGAITLDSLSGMVMDADNHLSFWRAQHECPLRGRPLSDAGSAPRKSDILKGRGVIYPIAVFERLGLLDERLARRSDPEMAYRAKLAGFPVYIDPTIIVRSTVDQRTQLSGKRLSLEDGFALLFKRRSYANLPDAFYYFLKCFGAAGLLCFMVHTARITLYFLYKFAQARLLRRPDAA